jgi:hypothetical protein
MKMPKELKPLAWEYEAKGWHICRTGSGHIKWTAPDGTVVTVTSTTPACGHTVAKDTARILASYERKAATP